MLYCWDGQLGTRESSLEVLKNLVIFELGAPAGLPGDSPLLQILFLQNWPRPNWPIVNTCSTIKPPSHYRILKGKKKKNLFFVVVKS